MLDTRRPLQLHAGRLRGICATRTLRVVLSGLWRKRRCKRRFGASTAAFTSTRRVSPRRSTRVSGATGDPFGWCRWGGTRRRWARPLVTADPRDRNARLLRLDWCQGGVLQRRAADPCVASSHDHAPSSRRSRCRDSRSRGHPRRGRRRRRICRRGHLPRLEGPTSGAPGGGASPGVSARGPEGDMKLLGSPRHRPERALTPQRRRLFVTYAVRGRHSGQRHRDNTVTRPPDFKRYTA